MSNPSPRQPSKLTCNLNSDGSQDCVLDIIEVSNEVPEDLKPYLEQRKRERRAARERATNPPGAPPTQPEQGE